MKKQNKIIKLTVLLCALALPLSAQADKGHGKGHAARIEHASKASEAPDRGDILLNRAFTSIERALITEYFGDQWAVANKTGTLPPGLAKRSELPPGLQKQLMRKGTLPPGLAKRALPNDLLTRLGPAPKGTQRYIAGADVILVDIATNVVLDILKGALNPPRSDIRWNQ